MRVDNGKKQNQGGGYDLRDNSGYSDDFFAADATLGDEAAASNKSTHVTDTSKTENEFQNQEQYNYVDPAGASYSAANINGDYGTENSFKSGQQKSKYQTSYNEETASENVVPLRSRSQSQNQNQTKNQNQNEKLKQNAPKKGFVYHEETSAEVAAPINLGRQQNKNQNQGENGDNNMMGAMTGANGLGFIALALSILSLFVMPVLLGAAGIIVGFIARRRGASTLGAWAIGIGIVSIVLGMFIFPFMR